MTADVKTKEIRKRMIDLGIRQIDLARELGVTQGAIWHTISGTSRSKRVARHIADKIDRPAGKLFGYLAAK